MRIISITLCLFAMSMVAVRADPEAAIPAPEVNQEALQAPALTEAQALEKFQEGIDSLSELDFRLAFVSANEEYSTPTKEQQAQEGQVNAEGLLDISCDSQKGALKAGIQSIRTAAGLIAIAGPLGSTLLTFINPILDKVIALADGDTGVFAPLLKGVAMAFNTLDTILSILSLPQFAILAPIVTALGALKPLVEGTLKCFFGGSVLSGLSVLDQATQTEYHCGPSADLYRLVITDAAKNSPALNLAADSSAELRRIAEGSLAVLNVMAKSAIAENNNQLLSVRPIFAADLLDQFREELSATAQGPAKDYADSYLVLAVGTTNALEACLRIAADPVAAIEELDSEIEAEEYENDEGEEEEGDEQEGEEQEEEVEGEEEEEEVQEQQQ